MSTVVEETVEGFVEVFFFFHVIIGTRPDGEQDERLNL